jgi:hypothetical protein
MNETMKNISVLGVIIAIIGLWVFTGLKITHKPVNQIITLKSLPIPSIVPPKATNKSDMSELEDEKALQRHWAAIKRCISNGDYPAMGYGFSTICVKRIYVDQDSSDPGLYDH